MAVLLSSIGISARLSSEEASGNRVKIDVHKKIMTFKKFWTFAKLADY